MIILAIDIETTGLDIEKAEIIEIAAILWDAKKSKILKSYSSLIKTEAQLPDEIVNLTKIDNDDLSNFGIELSSALRYIDKLQDDCDYLIAHNAKEFDAPILEKAGFKSTRPWLDTMSDLPIENFQSKKLTYLAADHSFINPFPHRALTDVLTLLKIFSSYEVEKIIQLSESQTVNVTASLDKDDPYFNDKKSVLKQNRFKWEGTPSYKWFLSCKEANLRKVIKPLEANNISYLIEKIGKKFY